MGLFNGGIFKSINKGLTKAWNINVQGTKLIGSALFPGAGNYLSQQETNAANLKMQQQINAQNLSLWNAQNAYNTPTEQMKRLEAAGLNPNLAYGQLADSKAGSAPTMESTHYEAPKNTGPGALEALATYQQVVNAQEQNKAIRVQNALAAEDLRYRKYENDTIIKAGQIKSDPAAVKLISRGADTLGNYAAGVVRRTTTPFFKAAKTGKGILNRVIGFGGRVVKSLGDYHSRTHPKKGNMNYVKKNK